MTHPIDFVAQFSTFQAELLTKQEPSALVIEYPETVSGRPCFFALTSFTLTKRIDTDWQIDGIAIDSGRRYFNMADIQNPRIETVKTIQNLKLYTGFVDEGDEVEGTTDEQTEE